MVVVVGGMVLNPLLWQMFELFNSHAFLACCQLNARLGTCDAVAQAWF